MSSSMPFVTALRAATAADHAMVDARFGALRLDDPADYRRMLRAHARALPALESALIRLAESGRVADTAWPAWRPRTPALLADLAALGVTAPETLDCAVDEEAAGWGALYVAEGSRLGGQLLARAVPATLPSAYLSARHLPGEWRGLLAAMEARAARAPAGWQADAIAGARTTFALYARAADVESMGALHDVTHSGD